MTLGPLPPRLLFNPQAAIAFLQALGADPQAVHYRAIHWDKHLLPRKDRAVHLPPSFEARAPRLEQLQQNGYRLYWLPNGGPEDRDVTTCSLLFVEWDDQPIDWQLQAWQELGLPEPTVMLNTGGVSIHCYWNLLEAIDVDRWRAITARLISYCKSDPTCKNPSRLMRLAGGAYIHKTDDKGADGKSIGGTIGPAPAAVVSCNPTAIYDAAIFEERLPQLPPPPPKPAPAPAPAPVTPWVGGMAAGGMAAGGTREHRSYEELERLVAAYPQIVADNDQYQEARDLACGLIRAMEAIGRSRADAVALLTRYHPQAGDTFDGVERWNFTAYGIESFVSQCKSKGVDVKRHDLPKTQPATPLDPELVDTSNQAIPDLTPQALRAAAAAAVAAPPMPPPMADEDVAEDAEAIAEAIEELRQADAIRLALADVLPRAVAEPLEQRAAAFPCDPMFFLLPLLCTVSGIVGRRLEVQVKRGWTEPLVLWGANVAPPGSMKSPAAKVISRPLYRIQGQLRRKLEADLAAWERARKHEEAGHADQEDHMLQWLAENPQPTLRRIVVTDATMERISQYFTAPATHGLVCFNDELAKWFDNLQRGGTEARSDTHNWCEGYDAGTIDVGRVSRGDVFVADCPISLFGSIQPGKMIAARKAAAKRNNGDPDGDGLLGRFAYVLPWRKPWRYNNLEVDVSALLLNLFREQIEGLVPPMRAAEDGDLMPTRLTFAPDALQQVVLPHLHALSDAGASSPGERAQWLDKARGRTLRLAGLLHVLELSVKEPQPKVTTPISVETAERAVLLSTYLLAQYELAMAEFGAGPDALPADVAKLLAKGLEWRREHGAKPVTMRQIQDWRLPAGSKGMGTAQRRAWVAAAVAAHPGMGQMVPGHKGDNWAPPAP